MYVPCCKVDGAIGVYSESDVHRVEISPEVSVLKIKIRVRIILRKDEIINSVDFVSCLL